jgi:hypothetical protein
LFKETHWAAVTSNIIWDLGITAITSATASPQTCSGKKMQAALFIGNTYERIAEEAAVGSGRHLRTALELFDCGADRHAAAISGIRSALGHAVATPGYVDRPQIDKAAQVYGIVERNVALACAA